MLFYRHSLSRANPLQVSPIKSYSFYLFLFLFLFNLLLLFCSGLEDGIGYVMSLE